MEKSCFSEHMITGIRCPPPNVRDGVCVYRMFKHAKYNSEDIGRTESI